MPSGAKKRKAAKKKQEQEASSTQINLKSNNHESRSQDDDAVRIKKEHEVDTDERIEITDSSHDHDKSSGSSSSSNSSSSSSSSDDESREVKKKDDSVSQVISVPDQPIPVAGDAPFMGSSANVIIEDTGLIDSTAANDPNSEKMIEILSVGGTMVSNETPLPKPNETTAQVSSGTDSDVKEASSSLLESNDVPQGSRESEVVISHEEEEAAPVRPTHGVAQRTSWLSCCGLFD